MIQANRPRLIGISGPSCSGKSTLANQLSKLLDHEQTVVVALDDYYRDLSHLSSAERASHNFDEPGAIESTLLAEHLELLISGRSVDAPLYDYRTSSRRKESHRLDPRPYIVLEGLFTWCWPSVSDMHDLRVFVDATNDACLRRRLERDVAERGHTTDSVERQYAETVRPMRRKHLAPLFAVADFVVDGEQDFSIAAERIEQHIKGAVQL